MSEIEAWQHVYANLRQEQSPTRRGGFQTVFHTKSGLSEAEVDEIEAHLVYYRSEPEPIKRVFFVTSTDKPVISQIVPQVGTDAIGRQGLYLAHSLVFRPESFTQSRIRPLEVLARFPFAELIHEALERGDRKTGDIPAVIITIPADRDEAEIEEARDWPAEALETVALCALQASELARDRVTLAFVGEPQAVEGAIRAALLAVPAALLPRCSFDTFFFRCNPVSTYYWAVGLPERPTSTRFAVVDAALRQVLTELWRSPTTAYERWVVETIRARRLDLLSTHREAAFVLGEWLDGRLAEVSESKLAGELELVRSMFRANAARLKEHIQRKLGEQFSPTLASLVAEEICRLHEPALLFQKMCRGFEPAEVMNTLYESYRARRFVAPGRDELRMLERLLSATDHQDLRLLLRCWTGRREELRQDLAALEDRGYRSFVEIALRYELTDALTLLLPGRTALFLDVYLPGCTLKHGELSALASALLRLGEPGALCRLVPHVAGCRKTDVRALRKILDQHAEVPRSFHEAVTAALAEQESPKWLRLFSAAFSAVPRRKKDDRGGPERLR
jgi:hypothetical protein